MNEDTYVYCTECKYFDENNYINDLPLPEKCMNGCEYHNPEDSFPLSERPNYKYYKDE